jgi:hypothetical protein
MYNLSKNFSRKNYIGGDVFLYSLDHILKLKTLNVSQCCIEKNYELYTAPIDQ